MKLGCVSGVEEGNGALMKITWWREYKGCLLVMLTIYCSKLEGVP